MQLFGLIPQNEDSFCSNVGGGFGGPFRPGGFRGPFRPGGFGGPFRPGGIGGPFNNICQSLQG